MKLRTIALGGAGLVALAAFTSGCDLSDPGCVSDDECRDGRVCAAARCLWPGDVPDGDGNNGDGNNGDANNGDANNGVGNNGVGNNGVGNNGIANNGVGNNGVGNNGIGNNGIDPSNNGVDPSNNGVEPPPDPDPQPTMAPDCDELARQGGRTTGYYQFVGSAGVPWVGYCYIVGDEGWTLVGRSTLVPSSAPIGWTHTVGTVNSTGPYSLAPQSVGLQFNEVMLTATTDDPDVPNAIRPDGPMYVFRPFPGSFIDSEVASSRSMRLEYRRGPCVNEEPQFLARWGYTFLSHFYMGDGEDLEMGLYSHGFRFPLVGGNCHAGGFDDLQGLVFVR